MKRTIDTGFVGTKLSFEGLRLRISPTESLLLDRRVGELLTRPRALEIVTSLISHLNSSERLIGAIDIFRKDDSIDTIRNLVATAIDIVKPDEYFQIYIQKSMNAALVATSILAPGSKKLDSLRHELAIELLEQYLEFGTIRIDGETYDVADTIECISLYNERYAKNPESRDGELSFIIEVILLAAILDRIEYDKY